MDWKIFFGAFTALFLAEMGDKTQLAVITMSASSERPLSVFLGAALSLVFVTALGVLFGRGAAHLIPHALLHRIAGTAFIAVGLWFWVRP